MAQSMDRSCGSYHVRIPSESASTLMSIIGRCPCGVNLDPAAILAYNHQVWDDEEPVTGVCCGPSFASTKPAAVCSALSHVRPNTSQLYTQRSPLRTFMFEYGLAFYCTRSGSCSPSSDRPGRLCSLPSVRLPPPTLSSTAGYRLTSASGPLLARLWSHRT